MNQPAAAANLIVNGDFSGGTFTGSNSQAQPSGWTFTQAASGSLAHVAFLGNPFPSYDFDGVSNGVFDTISQTFADVAGTALTLNFDLLGTSGSPAEVRAQFNGTTIFDVVNPNTGSVFVAQTPINLVATGLDTLAFQGFNIPSGTLIDNVVLTPAATSAPEVDARSATLPAALIMGGLLIVVDRRRRPVIVQAA